MVTQFKATGTVTVDLNVRVSDEKQQRCRLFETTICSQVILQLASCV